MADISLIIRLGWKNIWKQKVIWLFSALSIIPQLLNFPLTTTEPSLQLTLVYMLIALIDIILFLVSYIGVPFLAYQYFTGKATTIQETFTAVRKFTGRFVGCSCLSLLLFFPFIILFFVLAFNSTTELSRFYNLATLAGIPFAIFSSVWYFTFFGFFANNWGIRKSVKNAWSLFTFHFVALAILEIFLTLVLRVCTATAGLLTVLLQTGFDGTSLGALNLINPSMSLSNNILFAVMNGAIQMIYQTFSVSVYVVAYLKYGGEKIPHFQWAKLSSAHR